MIQQPKKRVLSYDMFWLLHVALDTFTRTQRCIKTCRGLAVYETSTPPGTNKLRGTTSRSVPSQPYEILQLSRACYDMIRAGRKLLPSDALQWWSPYSAGVPQPTIPAVYRRPALLVIY